MYNLDEFEFESAHGKVNQNCLTEASIEKIGSVIQEKIRVANTISGIYTKEIASNKIGLNKILEIAKRNIDSINNWN
ncbi:MAG: hypothetical protein P0S96_07310 [Simkaniaceae bacterium]|nr:hypothetical protein [Candidatus Sacchlamyda saccharinae]